MKELTEEQFLEIIKCINYYANTSNYYEDPEDTSILSMIPLDDLSKEPVTFGNIEIDTWVGGRRARQLLKKLNNDKT